MKRTVVDVDIAKRVFQPLDDASGADHDDIVTPRLAAECIGSAHEKIVSSDRSRVRAFPRCRTGWAA